MGADISPRCDRSPGWGRRAREIVRVFGLPSEIADSCSLPCKMVFRLSCSESLMGCATGPAIGLTR
jgi:hypothetical protein